MRAHQPYRVPRPSDYDTWMVAATRGHVPVVQPSAVTTNNQRAMTRKSHHVGYKGARALRLTHTGWRLDSSVSTSGLEVNCGNDRLVEAAIEITGAPTPVVRVLYGGANVGTIVDGARKYVSDPILPASFGLTSFAPNQQFWVRLQETVSIGQFHLRTGPLMSLTGESSKQSSTVSASQVMNEGVLTTPASGSSINAGWCAASIEGLPLTSHGISWGNAGDSIDDNFNATGRSNGSDGSDGLGGWLLNGLYNAGRQIPYVCLAQSGSTIKVSGPNFDRRMDFVATVTDFSEGWGTNDQGVGGTPAETAADTFARKAELRRRIRVANPHIRIHARSILARVSSNNGNQFLTPEEQSPRLPSYATGGSFRDPMIAADLAALAAGDIDGYIDLNSVLCVGDKFITDGVTPKLTVDDGTHPSDSGGVLGGAYFAAYVAELLAHLPYR